VIKIDLAKNKETLKQFLLWRNPEADADKQLAENAFIQMNKTDDVWFWAVDLVHYFYGELLEQIFNFYQGPLPLMAVEQMIMN
jgi:hypothetical protein